jgi:hypothetical protein
MGTVDRTIRIIVAVVVAYFIVTGQLSVVASIILGILALVFLLTSFVGHCPLYVPLKLSTKRRDTSKEPGPDRS